VHINCEIFDFNKFANTGKLIVGDGQPVPKGEYKFWVIGDQDVSEYISAMLRKHVNVTCLRELAQNPFSQERVIRLQLINVGSKAAQ
jgi:hypothetical protein